jgi:hypothetical protein
MAPGEFSKKTPLERRSPARLARRDRRINLRAPSRRRVRSKRRADRTSVGKEAEMTPTIADRMANEDPPMHHQNIVRIIDTLTVSGRAAILMEKAGDRTLAERLRGDDMPSLDLSAVRPRCRPVRVCV